MNWTAIENALVAEIKLAVQGTGATVMWRDQTRKLPSRPYVALAWLDAEPQPNTAPQEMYRDTPGAPAGAELTQVSCAQYRGTLRVETYCSAITTDTAAFPLALKIASQLTGLDSVERLRAAGLGVDVATRVQSVPDVFETEHESRAVLSLACNFTVETTSTLTFVQSAGVEVQLDNNGGIITRQFDVP